MATTLLQCLKGSIKVESVLDASRIAWYLQRIKKEDYDTEQANYEAQDPQAEYRSWEVFVRNAILVQILETKPRNRRVEFYNKSVLRGFGIRKLSALKKEQPNHEFHEARHRLAQRADDEYRRYCQRHPHRSGRNGRRVPQLDPPFENEDENPPVMPYKEFFIRVDPSFYAIKRCAESMMDRENGHKYTRGSVYEAAPPLPPAPVHHGPGAFPPEPFRYNAAPPPAPSQEVGGNFSLSDDEGAFSAHGGRGSSLASSHSAAFPSRGDGREPNHGLDLGAAIFPESPHRQPNHPSEISHRPATSPTPSHGDPSRLSSRASSDRHTESSKASSRASSRAPSQTFSNRPMASSASSSISGTRAGSHAGFDESIAIAASSARRPSRAHSQASGYGANIRPSDSPSRQPIQAPSIEPTFGNFRSAAATAGEAALVRATIATSSQLSVPGNKQLRNHIIVAPEGSNDKEPAIGSGRASSRSSSSTTTRISKGKEPASRSNAERVADSSEPSSDENDIESISSWHSDGGRGPPKWGNRESLAWEMVSGK